VVEPPSLKVRSGEPPEEPPRRYRRRGLAAHVPVVAGIVIGAAAIAVAVVLLRGGGNGEAATPVEPAPPATTAVLPTLRIVFPEGFTREDMADRIAAVNDIAREERELVTALVPDEYRSITKNAQRPPGFGSGRSLEGFLFPATYTFTPATITQELVDMQLAAFEEAWSQIDLADAETKNLTPYDVLVIASMIEEEVRVPKERKLVAAVIYNRLKARIPLGIDATLRYGLGIPPTEAITQSDLESDNPYNTRKVLGLPPTPISNPGLASMQAAAHPAKADYLYFVRKKDCKSHYFARTEAQFLRFLEGPNSFRNGPNQCA
jgi:uncharacterized YceG family protein